MKKKLPLTALFLIIILCSVLVSVSYAENEADDTPQDTESISQFEKTPHVRDDEAMPESREQNNQPQNGENRPPENNMPQNGERHEQKAPPEMPPSDNPNTRQNGDNTAQNNSNSDSNNNKLEQPQQNTSDVFPQNAPAPGSEQNAPSSDDKRHDFGGMPPENENRGHNNEYNRNTENIFEKLAELVKNYTTPLVSLAILAAAYIFVIFYRKIY